MSETYIATLILCKGAITIDNGKITETPIQLKMFHGRTLEELETTIYKKRHTLKLERVEDD